VNTSNGWKSCNYAAKGCVLKWRQPLLNEEEEEEEQEQEQDESCSDDDMPSLETDSSVDEADAAAAQAEADAAEAVADEVELKLIDVAMVTATGTLLAYDAAALVAAFQSNIRFHKGWHKLAAYGTTWEPLEDSDMHQIIAKDLREFVQSQIPDTPSPRCKPLRSLADRLAYLGFRRAVLEELTMRISVPLLPSALPRAAFPVAGALDERRHLVNEWLEKRVIRTGSKKDHVVFEEVVNLFLKDASLCGRVSFDEFKVYAKSFLASVSLSFKHQDGTHIDGKRRCIVAKGVKLMA
jgi:hypothetical protein